MIHRNTLLTIAMGCAGVAMMIGMVEAADLDRSLPEGGKREIKRLSRYERMTVEAQSEERSDRLRRKFRIGDRIPIHSPSQGEDILIAVYRMSEQLPEGSVTKVNQARFLFSDDRIVSVYALHDKEPVRVGSKGYSFEREGNKLLINYVDGGTVKSVRCGYGDAWVSNGHLFTMMDPGRTM